MQIFPYQYSNRKECLHIFESNMPLFFDQSELPDFEGWLNGQDENRLAYSQTVKEYYFVAKLNQKVVGCGGYYIPKEEQRSNLVWGMVHRDYHSQGVGSALLLHRLAHIKLVYPNYPVTMDTSQHTIKFFQKQGFTIQKIIPDGYAKGLHRYDMIKNEA